MGASKKWLVVVDIARMLGMAAPSRTAGSTEPKAILVTASERLDLGLDTATATKHDLARALCESAGLPWDVDCYAAGQTITAVGLERVREAVRIGLDRARPHLASGGAGTVRSGQVSPVTGAINIRPGVGILALFPHMNYRPWYAIGEFVDNALASYLANKDRLGATGSGDYQFRVVIDYEGDGNGHLRVWDNAAGIATADYARAFVTAEPPPDSTGLSQFGIGMKSASCWFARQWQVRTTALGETAQRTIFFDVPRIVRDGISDLSPTIDVAPADDHFTEVRLWDLYKPPQTKTLGKIREHLTSIYREFLRSGELSLEFRGDALAFEEPRVLVAPRWDEEDGKPRRWLKKVDFRLSTGERVTGFAGLRDKGSTRLAGLALFRNRRLVVGSYDETYRPPEVFGGTNSYRYQRLYGELSLEGFDISHTKDGFIWGDREGAFLDALRRHLDAEPMPLLAQAERYRSRKADQSVERAAAKALDSTVAAIGAARELIEDQSAPGADPGSLTPPVTPPAVAQVSNRTLSLLVRGEIWEVTIEVTNDPAHTDWLTIADDSGLAAPNSPRRLLIRVSLSNEFMRRFAGATAEEVEPLMRLAAGLALAETTARSSGVRQAGIVRIYLNQLLETALARA